MANETTTVNTTATPTRTIGRTFGEAVIWGAGFAIGAGVMHIIWGAITKDDEPEETPDGIYEGED